jgi:hypothetical protein
MDLVLRTVFVFVLIFVVTRAVGRRELTSMEPFDMILLVVLGDLVQQGVTQSDYSLTGMTTVVATLALLAVLTAWLSFGVRRLRPLLGPSWAEASPRRGGRPRGRPRRGTDPLHVVRSRPSSRAGRASSCRTRSRPRCAAVKRSRDRRRRTHRDSIPLPSPECEQRVRRRRVLFFVPQPDEFWLPERSKLP